MNKRSIAILLVLLALASIGGAGYYFIYRGEKNPPRNIVDFEEFIELPDSSEIAAQLESRPQGEEVSRPAEPIPPPAAAMTHPEKKEESEMKEPSPSPLPSAQSSQEKPLSQTSPPLQEQSPSPAEEMVPDMGNIDIDVENISVPDIGGNLGSGISVSGTIALEEAYYREHDLQKAQKLALEILKKNPNDPTANKILKLIEYESRGNQALMKGDYSTALQYFQKMQEIDPNNKWAKKGIIRAQSGG